MSIEISCVAPDCRPSVLLADTLAGVQEQLPSGLVRVGWQPADPLEVVEIWFA